MTSSDVFVDDNSHLIEVKDLQDFAGTAQTDATVQLTALVERGQTTAITGVTLPLTLTHISAGTYRGSLPAEVAFVKGKIYEATIKATGSQGFKAEWKEILIAKDRHD